MTTKISLHVSNNKAYVWNAEDAAALRAAHHITGQLTGTLPSLAQQNIFLGLPLLLMPEEVVYLVEKEVVALLDATSGQRLPTVEEFSRWNAEAEKYRSLAIHELDTVRKEKEESRGQRTTEAAQRKRKEREAKKALALSAGEGLLDLGTPGEVLVHEQPPPTKDKDAAYTIIIPATSSDHTWIEPPRYDTLNAAKEAGVWTYPSTPLERAKCAVFADLIHKGYFLGPGLKFGGDWLVYPGDQLRYHSHFVATVLLTATTKLTPMQIVAYGRLGTATKKAHLLCGWDQESNVVDYYSIEWAYFG